MFFPAIKIYLIVGKMSHGFILRSLDFVIFGHKAN